MRGRGSGRCVSPSAPNVLPPNFSSLDATYSYYIDYYYYTNTDYTTNTTTTTHATTTMAGNGRGKRGGRLITSRITALIFLLLLDGPQTAHEIVEYVNSCLGTGYSYNLVKQYLYYYRKRGILVYSDGLWSLSDEGEKLVNRIRRWLCKLVGDGHPSAGHCVEVLCPIYRESSSRYNLSIRKVEVEYNSSIREVELRHSDYSDVVEKLKREFELDNDEVDVIRILLEHYVRTGSTYMYIEELANRMETTPSWLYQNVLRRLKSRGIVYIWRDGKVGIGRTLKNILASSGGSI